MDDVPVCEILRYLSQRLKRTKIPKIPKIPVFLRLAKKGKTRRRPQCGALRRRRPLAPPCVPPRRTVGAQAELDCIGARLRLYGRHPRLQRVGPLDRGNDSSAAGLTASNCILVVEATNKQMEGGGQDQLACSPEKAARYGTSGSTPRRSGSKVRSHCANAESSLVSHEANRIS